MSLCLEPISKSSYVFNVVNCFQLEGLVGTCAFATLSENYTKDDENFKTNVALTVRSAKYKLVNE